MSRLMQHIVISELEDLAKRIASNIETTGQKNTGQTARSMHVEKDGDIYTLWGRGGFYGLEVGLHHRPPINPIYNWIMTKGLAKETPQKTRSFAFAIAHKMGTEGSFLYRNKRTFGGVANPDVYSSEIKKTVQNLYDKLGAAVISQLETITLNF